MSVIYQFVADAGFGGTVIRWFTWSRISHVDIVFPDGSLLGARDGKIGQVPAGVQIRPPDYKKFTTVIRAQLPCSNVQAEVLYAAAKSQIGKPYDKEAVLDFGFHDEDSPPSEKSRAWICSELAAWAALKAGVPIINIRVNYQQVTPEDLLKSPVLVY